MIERKLDYCHNKNSGFLITIQIKTQCQGKLRSFKKIYEMLAEITKITFKIYHRKVYF